jgi:hypothetical protein
MTVEKDAFGLWREWLKRPPLSMMTLPEEIMAAVMTLTPEERTRRATVNEAVRTQSSPLRPAGSEDRYGVPKATE